MCGMKEVVFLSILAAINPTDLGTSKIIYPATVKRADVESLIPLLPNQALPFISLDRGPDGHLQFPMGLTEIEIVDGRLASGTEFFTVPPTEQIFFCSDPEEEHRCLAPKQFERSQVLECEHEAEPSIIFRNMHKSCGPRRTGILMMFFYTICSAKLPYTYKSTGFHPYGFCLNKFSKRNLFVHYETHSAGLLSEKIFESEREITFAVNEQTKGYVDHRQAENKPQYKFQKMVPSEIMPFALWRKTTYSKINMALQHKKLIDLWNEINYHIRINAIETSQLPRSIVTGLIDIPQNEFPLSRDKNQIYNIWITTVVDKNLKTHKGLAIMMNNFITKDERDKKKQKMSESNEVEFYINKICDKIPCVDTLNRKFEDVGGQVRCCRVTQTIKGFFYTDGLIIKSIDTVLQIRNLTYNEVETENEEIRNPTYAVKMEEE